MNYEEGVIYLYAIAFTGAVLMLIKGLEFSISNDKRTSWTELWLLTVAYLCSAGFFWTSIIGAIISLVVGLMGGKRFDIFSAVLALIALVLNFTMFGASWNTEGWNGLVAGPGFGLAVIGGFVLLFGAYKRTKARTAT